MSSPRPSRRLSDVNGDSYIDEYDLFVKESDKNNDLKISKAEFTDPISNKLTTPTCSPRSTTSAS